MAIHTSNTTASPLENIDNIELASFIYIQREAAAMALAEADRAAFVLLRRMEADGASAVDHPGLVVKLERPSPVYDPTKLHRLYEVAPRDEVNKAYTPAHDEVVHVPDKWSAVKFKPLLKYGAAVAEVLGAAMLPGGPPRLKITAKKETQ